MEFPTVRPLGPPPTYDESAKPVKTYCHECGAETGEERPHAKNCPCIYCVWERKLAPRYVIAAAPKTVTFRKLANIG